MWATHAVAFFSATPAIPFMAASYLLRRSAASISFGMGLALSSHSKRRTTALAPARICQPSARCRRQADEVVIHMTDAGLVGSRFVTAAGLIVYGAIGRSRPRRHMAARCALDPNDGSAC